MTNTQSFRKAIWSIQVSIYFNYKFQQKVKKIPFSAALLAQEKILRCVEAPKVDIRIVRFLFFYIFCFICFYVFALNHSCIIIRLKKMHSSMQPEIKLEEKQNALDRAKMNYGPFSINRDDLDSFGEFKKNADWTMQQNAKYVAFIEANLKKMDGKPHGKLWEVYQEMAKIVKTRNFRQCKSHHQKMLNQHKSIPQIISALLKSNSKLQISVSKQRDSLPQAEAIICNLNEYVEQAGNEKDKHEKITADKYADQQEYYFNTNQNVPMASYPVLFNYQISKNKSEQWKECHQLFIEWTTRLRSLMMPPHYC